MYKPSEWIKEQIRQWEGSSMKTNRAFELEARDFENILRKAGIFDLLSQEELDPLFSLSYNIGSTMFKKRVVPSLVNLYKNNGKVEDVLKNMYGLKDSNPNMPGLKKRRDLEKKYFMDAYTAKHPPRPTLPEKKIYKEQLIQQPDKTRVASPPFFDFSKYNPLQDTYSYEADKVMTEFDLPLYTSNYKNGGKLIKKHQYGGTLASKYIQRFYSPSDPRITYVNFEDAKKANMEFTNDITDPNSGAFFSYEIANEQQGSDENNKTFRNNIQGHTINPKTTFLAIDPLGRIINNQDYNVIINGKSLIPTTGHVFDETKGWIPAPVNANGEIIDQDLLDQAEQAARFLSDRGFEHAWRMSPLERIKFARSIQQSDAAGQSIIFGSQLPMAAKGAYTWLTGTNTGRALTGATLMGELFNQGSKALGYNDYGDAMSQTIGGNSLLWNLFGNPGYISGHKLVTNVADKVLTQAIKPAAQTVKQATHNMVSNSNNTRGEINFSRFIQGMLNGTGPNSKRIMLESLKNELPAGSVTIYSPEEAISKKSLGETNDLILGDLNSPELSEPLGQIYYGNDPYVQLATALLNWKAHNELNLSTLKKVNNSYQIPNQTIVNKNFPKLKTTNTLSDFITSLNDVPMVIVHHKNIPPDHWGKHFFSENVSNGKGTGEITHLVQLLNGLELSPETIKSIYTHENLGHSFNVLAKYIRIPELGNITLEDAYKNIIALNGNKKLQEIIWRNAAKAGVNLDNAWVEAQAMFNSEKPWVYEDIVSKKNLDPYMLARLAKNGDEYFVKLFDDYTHNLTVDEFENIIRRSSGFGAAEISALLPGSTGIINNLSLLSQPRPTDSRYFQYLYDTMKMMKDQGITWTKKDADSYFNYLKTLFRSGLSVAGLVSTLGLQENNSNKN